MNKNTILAIFILSVILLIALNYDNSFSFTISHSYEIGSVRKPRQMHWKTPNWEMIMPLVSSTLSFVYLIILRKKN